MSTSLSRKLSGPLAARRSRIRRRRPQARLRYLEALEPRTLLSNTWYVDSSNLEHSPNGSETDPYKTIQAAIDQASSGDTILVETGDGYNESDTVAVPKLTIEADASRGASPILDGSTPTFLNAPGFEVSATGVTISGFTIQDFGTGVVAKAGSSLTLSDDRIQDNSTGGDGGGVWNSGDLFVSNCTLQGNSAYYGGAIYNPSGALTITDSTIGGTTTGESNFAFYGGGVLNLGTLTINGGTFAGNSAGFGGGIDSQGMATVTGTTISDDDASDGGGIFNVGTLTVTDATISGDSAGVDGGGIDNYGGGTLNMTGSTVSGNSASADGGGLCNEYGATMTVNDSFITGNRGAGQGDGGGIGNAGTAALIGSTISKNVAVLGGGLLNGGLLIVDDCSVEDNGALSYASSSGSGGSGAGGGLLNGGSALITDSTISDNDAPDGGGIYQVAGALTITDSTILDNDAGNEGGGIDEVAKNQVTITNCTLSSNTAKYAGCGIENDGSLTVSNSLFYGNTGLQFAGFNYSTQGGAIANGPDGNLTLGASTLFDNTADFGGGLDNEGLAYISDSTIGDNSALNAGAGIDNMEGTLTAVNATVADNVISGSTVAEGGGLEAAGGLVLLYNTIVASNTDGAGTGARADDIAGGAVSAVSSNNLIGTGGSGGLTGGTNSNQVDVADPGLSSYVAYNGGRTPTIALLAGSPAIDAGDNTLAVDANDNLLVDDQRGEGYPRFYGGIVDIGAFQAQVNAPTPTNVYVRASYAGDALWTPVEWTDGSVHVVGYDAFGTIQDGINGVASGGTVNIGPGTYTGSLTITSDVIVVGSSTVIQAPDDAGGVEVEISGPSAGVSLSDLTIEQPGGRFGTAIDVDGGSLGATDLDIAGFSVGLSVEDDGNATIVDSTISSDNTGILIGSDSDDRANLTATNDSFANDFMGVQNNESFNPVTATFDWWGSQYGPGTYNSVSGVVAGISGNVDDNPWLGDPNIVAPDFLVYVTSSINQYAVTPGDGNTTLNVTDGSFDVGSVPFGGAVAFDGNGTGGTVTINGDSGPGSDDLFTVYDEAVEVGSAGGSISGTIAFFGTGITRNVDALGTTDTFQIESDGGGPSGTLVGDSGTNAFVFGGDSMLAGNIQGGTSSTLDYSGYAGGVSVKLGNGTAGKATGVTGTVTGITAIIGSNFNDSLNAGSVGNVALTGGPGTNTLSGTGSGDSVVESIGAGYVLTNTTLTGTGPGGSFTDDLSGIKVADLTDLSAGGNTFAVTGWTGKGSLTGTSETVEVNVSANAALANTSLAVTGGPSLILNGFTTANLYATGSSTTFTITGWTGNGSLTAKSGTATVSASEAAGFTLSPSSLTAGTMSLSLNGISTANLTDTTGGHTITINGWTGAGKLTGTGDTVVERVSAGVTLSNTSLAVTGLTALTLKGITTADLTGTSGGITFTVSGWTGNGTLTYAAKSTSPDTVLADKNAGYTLTDSSLSSTDGMSLGLLGNFGIADLTATGSGKTFTVGGWTRSGTLTDSAGGIVAASQDAGFTLTSTSLTSGDFMSLALSGFTTANLTDSGSGHTFTIGAWTGKGSLNGTSETLVDSSLAAGATLKNTSLAVTGLPTLTLSGFTTADLTVTTSSASTSSTIVDASAFTAGPTNLTAAGSGGAILYGGTAGHDILTVAGSGDNIVVGNGPGDTLSDSGGGFNILIGAGTGGDTISGNGNDILVSGTTKYDSDTSAHIAALDAILAEWTSSDSYSTRISKIESGVGSGSYAFDNSTITPDTNASTLSDGSSQPSNTNGNWFIAGIQDTVQKNTGETLTIIKVRR